MDRVVFDDRATGQAAPSLAPHVPSPSARRRQLIGGGSQHAGQLAGLSRAQIVNRPEAGHPHPSLGAVSADNIAHDKITVRARSINDPRKTFN